MGKIITLTDNKAITLKNDGNKSITLIVDTDKPTINYEISDCSVEILVYIRLSGNVSLNEKGYISNSNATIKYIELSDHEFVQKTDIDVKENSTLTVDTIYLGVNNKHIDFDLVNRSSDTEVIIHNNAVCLDGSSLVMNVIGTIVKGAKRSKCHQKNHCLTIGNPKKAEVLPVLKIDENDVEASHSLSSGTIDEEVMFYMNSRGLSPKEALNLMVLSYLLPSKEEFERFEMGDDLYELSLRKVEEVCSM